MRDIRGDTSFRGKRERRNRLRHRHAAPGRACAEFFIPLTTGIASAKAAFLSNENDHDRTACYDAPQELPTAAKLIRVAAIQSTQFITDCETALDSWKAGLMDFFIHLATTANTGDMKLRLQSEIGLHPALAHAIATLWPTLETSRSAASLVRAMHAHFSAPEFVSTVLDSCDSDVLRFMLVEQLKALMELKAKIEG